MKTNLSRRTFVKFVSATGAALFAKFSELLPEAQLCQLIFSALLTMWYPSTSMVDL